MRDGCLLSASSDGTVILWDPARTNALETTLPSQGVTPSDVRFTGSALVATGAGGSLLWDTAALRSRLPGRRFGAEDSGPAPITGDAPQTGYARALLGAVTRDGSTLVQVGDSERMWVWDVRRGSVTVLDVERLTGRTGALNALAVSPDGRFAAVAPGKAVVLYDLQRHVFREAFTHSSGRACPPRCPAIRNG